jgi:hypothetical protein
MANPMETKIERVARYIAEHLPPGRDLRVMSAGEVNSHGFNADNFCGLRSTIKGKIACHLFLTFAEIDAIDFGELDAIDWTPEARDRRQLERRVQAWIAELTCGGL